MPPFTQNTVVKAVKNAVAFCNRRPRFIICGVFVLLNEKRGGVFHRAFHHDFNQARKVILVGKIGNHINPFGTTGTPMSPKSNDSYLSTKGCEENYFWIIIIFVIPKFLEKAFFSFFLLFVTVLTSAN